MVFCTVILQLVKSNKLFDITCTVEMTYTRGMSKHLSGNARGDFMLCMHFQWIKHEGCIISNIFFYTYQFMNSFKVRGLFHFDFGRSRCSCNATNIFNFDIFFLNMRGCPTTGQEGSP